MTLNIFIFFKIFMLLILGIGWRLYYYSRKFHKSFQQSLPTKPGFVFKMLFLKPTTQFYFKI